MAKKIPILRVAGPTVLVSLVLFAVCTAAAVFLYRLHASTAENLTEDLDSRKVASDLETTLRNLVTLVRPLINAKQRNGSEQVDTLHEHIRGLIKDGYELADTDKETEMIGHVEQSFDHYHAMWDAWLKNDAIPKADPLQILQTQTIPRVVALRNYSNLEIEKSEANLKRTVKWIAWGLVAVGTIGSLGGILLGYGVARGLRQSIYKLSVRIRDAADKLRHDLPTVTLNEAEGIDYLHEQMQGLVREIEQMVQRLNQREREVLRAEQMAAVGQLAAGVAHELRNPLTAVKMLVQTSREDMAARGLPAEDLLIIEQEIRRLERSLQTFLDFARPPKMERRRLDLNTVVDEALALINGRARKQKIEVVFDPPEPEVWLEADGTQLRQLLVNLAMNALDAMPSGGRLRVEVRPAVKGYVELQVTDTGPGIAAEVMPRLFEPFVSGKETGLGLGLVVSRRIAEEHGGTLTGANLAKGGACFTLELPATVPAKTATTEAVGAALPS